MEAPGLLINGEFYRNGDRISSRRLTNPIIGFPFEKGGIYAIIVRNRFGIFSFVANINPSSGYGGDVLSAAPRGPVVSGDVNFSIYSQQDPFFEEYDPKLAPTFSESDLSSWGFRKLISVDLLAEEPDAQSNDTHFVKSVKRAIRGDYGHLYVDVSRIEPKRGAPTTPLYRGRDQRHIGITNMPRFPIVSRTQKGWDTATEIMSRETKNPRWLELVGKWGQSVDDPGRYDIKLLMGTSSDT